MFENTRVIQSTHRAVGRLREMRTEEDLPPMNRVYEDFAYATIFVIMCLAWVVGFIYGMILRLVAYLRR